MRNIHKRLTPQQILDYYPHPIPQPDTEEARHARVGQQFRLYFFADALRKATALGKKPASPARLQKACALLGELKAMDALMRLPQNHFLVEGHGRLVEDLLADTRALI